MTLNVTVRVPDGIVIASDSLASQQLQVQLPPLNVPHKCSGCQKEETLQVQVPPPPFGVPANSSPLANKLFYIGQYGISFHGAAAVGRRTLCNHVLNYVHTDFAPSKSVQEVARDLGKVLHDALKKDVDVTTLAPTARPIGFQIAGYNGDDLDLGTTLMVGIGRDVAIQNTSTQGVTYGGQGQVADRIYRRMLPTDHVSLDLMTLSDAVDFARFLIQTTSDYQRFAQEVPTVGGPVDIAIITKWAGFRWVQRKTLLSMDEVRLNVGKIAHEVRTLSDKRHHLAAQPARTSK